MYCWSLAWRILSITLLACEMSAIVQYFECSLALPFFGIGMKTDLFQSCGHCCVFQICWFINSHFIGKKLGSHVCHQFIKLFKSNIYVEQSHNSISPKGNNFISQRAVPHAVPFAIYFTDSIHFQSYLSATPCPQFLQWDCFIYCNTESLEPALESAFFHSVYADHPNFLKNCIHCISLCVIRFCRFWQILDITFASLQYHEKSFIALKVPCAPPISPWKPLISLLL